MKLGRCDRTLLVIFCYLGVLLFGVSLGWSQSEHTAKLIEGARKEGRLVWYTSFAASAGRYMLDAFKKKYPFAEIELLRASDEGIMNRIMTETRAGKWNFDLAAINGAAILVHQKLLSSYVSPEAKAYIPELKDPSGHWTGMFVVYFVLGYNTKLISEKEAPKRWEGLVDPKWKGKTSIDREEYPWYAALLEAWGREKSEKYMKALAQQDIQWRKGHTLIAQLMAAGEFPLAIVYAHTVESMKKMGAPLDWVHTLDPIVVSVNGIGLSGRPNNPNTAKLFIDFILSKEGQELIRSLDRIPARSDVEPPVPKLDQRRLKLRVVPQDMAMRYNEYAQEFRRIFGL